MRIFSLFDVLCSLLLLLITLFILPLLIDSYTLNILVIYGMLALSLGLIWGYGGILCFGQTVFFGLGAYVYAVSAMNIGESTVPFLLGMIIPCLVSFLLGSIMFYGRLGDVYLSVITLVFTLILFKLMNATGGPDFVIGNARLGGFNGIPGYPTLNVPGRPELYIWGDNLYYFSVILLFLVYMSFRYLLFRPFGRVMVGIRENELRIELQGYDVRLYKTVMFSVGGLVAGLSGVLYANWSELVTPNLFALGLSAEIIIWCLVGGLGTLIGPILGAIILGYLKFLLGQQTLLNNMVLMGGILVLSVLFFPRGVTPYFISIYYVVMGNLGLSKRKSIRRPLVRGVGDSNE